MEYHLTFYGIHKLIDKIRNNIRNNIKEENDKIIKKVKKIYIMDEKLINIPHEIGIMINLKYLNISYNKLESLPPEIGNLINLEYLYFSHNNLKKLPLEIGNLVNLRNLSIDGNAHIEIPLEIKNLINLEVLDISDSDFTSFPPEIIIPMVVFASLFGVVYLFFTTRHKERMFLIEKGQNAELFNKEHKDGKWGLKIGIMAMGIGCGILFGYLFSSIGLIQEDVAFPAMIFLFAGAGLVASHFIVNKK